MRVCVLVAAIVWTHAIACAATTLPKVLIIGDSISMRYMEPLALRVQDKAEVVHNEGNAAHTRNGVEQLEAWLGDTKWEVIHFNFGLHDIKYVDHAGGDVASEEAGRLQVPLDDYRKNLTKIAERLKATGAKIIFATTTPFPETARRPMRSPADLQAYNEVALEVMKAQGIEVNDLHGVALPHLAKWQRRDNVHFIATGYNGLADAVAQAVLGALGMEYVKPAPVRKPKVIPQHPASDTVPKTAVPEHEHAVEPGGQA